MVRHTVQGVLGLLMALSAGLAIAAEDVRMVVTAAFVSEQGIGVYQDLADYISQRLGVETRLISDTDYEVANLLLEQDIVQVGFVCGLPYVQKHAEGKVKLVAIPVIADDAAQIPGTPGYAQVPGKYYSYTIVHKDADLNSWADLKGKTYVYNEQTSNSGYNMPRYKLIQLGARSWEEWFSEVRVSGSHEESIRMVANGRVDASSVDSLVLDYELHVDDPYAKQVKVIETLFPGGAGIPPVVVAQGVPETLRKQLQDILTSMHKEPEGRAILDKALLKRFDPPNDRNYDDIRRMVKAAETSHFRDHIRSHSSLASP